MADFYQTDPKDQRGKTARPVQHSPTPSTGSKAMRNKSDTTLYTIFQQLFASYAHGACGG
ncbi:hypothetical protein [Pseudomonas knackmussii]|uniref:hypothetical protein n=1 Tax=Pseudomonas knackmussii TaxID=65741 RepID=UPI0012EBFDF7|nr:hypothetical protein [Pseudomonas knackmussii]